MSAVDRSGPVDIVLGGSVVTVPYRRAVGLIATGKAQWVEAEVAAVKPRPRKLKQLKPERGTELVDLPPKPVSVPPSTPIASGDGSGGSDLFDVSTPTTGVEGDVAGNEPPPSDP